uniref:Putative secreted protein n=1 Tax=Panstrongylus lignarius TaxID=156445 RepID=A0A224XUD3_9HEMI
MTTSCALACLWSFSLSFLTSSIGRATGEGQCSGVLLLNDSRCSLNDISSEGELKLLHEVATCKHSKSFVN